MVVAVAELTLAIGIPGTDQVEYSEKCSTYNIIIMSSITHLVEYY